MFNWLKSDKGSKVAERLATVEGIDTSNLTLVQKIHRDFKTKGDLLVLEANNILKEATFKELKTKKELLHECGFTNTKVTQDINILEEKIKRSEVITNYSNQLLGQYKIITTEDILKICSKYKLCMSLSRNYNAEVPIKNLNEIKTFFNSYKSRTNTSDYNLSRDNTCIVAPEKDFNKGTNFLIKENLMMKLEDPIVLFPCNNSLRINNNQYGDNTLEHQYFYVVTAWGDEASDELVVNNKMN